MQNKLKFFYLKNEQERKEFLQWRDSNPHVSFLDNLGEQKHELRLVRDPKLVSHASLQGGGEEPGDAEGVWVYFPWRNTAVRILEDSDYEELRLARNKNLITEKEQTKLLKSKIGIMGLNVGSSGAVCMALEGVTADFRLADFDPLSVSNLNRFNAGLPDIGTNKALLTARHINEITPYAKVKLFEEGISQENMDDFLDGLDLLIEEIDNLKLKIKVREKAKEKGISVLMVTGNSEDVIVDIERYDKEKNLDILSGYLKEEIKERILNMKKGEGTYRERIELARDFMGKEFLDKRLLDSFEKVGVSLAGIPQLAEASYLRGATLAHFAKKIILDQNVKSGRYKVSITSE